MEGTHRVEAVRPGDAPRGRVRQEPLIKGDAGARAEAPGELPREPAGRLPERPGEIAERPAVGKGGEAAGELDSRGERRRAENARPRVAGVLSYGLLAGVEVAQVHIAGAALLGRGAGAQPPAARALLRGDPRVEEQPERPRHRRGLLAAPGELGQEESPARLAGGDPRGLVKVPAGQRRGEQRYAHRPVPQIVPEPMTMSPASSGR